MTCIHNSLFGTKMAAIITLTCTMDFCVCRITDDRVNNGPRMPTPVLQSEIS